jgi:hypothetical protein
MNASLVYTGGVFFMSNLGLDKEKAMSSFTVGDAVVFVETEEEYDGLILGNECTIQKVTGSPCDYGDVLTIKDDYDLVRMVCPSVFNLKGESYA